MAAYQIQYYDEKMFIYWASIYWREGGNAYGYSTHNRKLMEAVEARPDCELSPDARVSFALTTSDRYERIPDRFNFLLTMFETDTLPTAYVEGLQYADHIIVPCNHNKWLFGKYTDKPIDVCWEGVDLNDYPFEQRRFPIGRPFRFLWLAAPNVRKGWECLIAGWKAFHDVNRAWITAQRQSYVLNPQPLFELYIKTTVTEKLETDIPGVVWDSRNLSIEELRDLYESAHCFVLPTMGEGFGLTLAEAMASGCPCVSTSITGTADFFDNNVGYVIKVEEEKHHVEIDGVTHGVYMPDPNSMVEQMKQCYDDYATGRAQRKARRARKRIEEQITWDISADRLVKIIRDGVPEPQMLYSTIAGEPEPSYCGRATNGDKIKW